MSRGPYAGIAGDVRLMSELREGATTIPAFRDRVGLSNPAAYCFILGLHRMGHAHIESWVLRPRVRPVAEFAFGPGTDAPMPKITLSGCKSLGKGAPVARRMQTTMICLCKVLDEIKEHQSTIADLSEVTGMFGSVLRRAMRALIDAGFAHIVAWERSKNGPAMPAYRFGPGRAAPKPASSYSKSYRKVINAKAWARRRERLRAEAITAAFRSAA